MIDYTLVLGVDYDHLPQLAAVWPTWVKHKPSLGKKPLVIFYDRDQVNPYEIADKWGIGDGDTKLVPWPPEGVSYPVGTDKWTRQQRYRMLSGFVHVPAEYVRTDYWLKLDTDVVATGMDDWIDPNWFKDYPGIVSHRWGYTKPANQMEILDEWSMDAERQGLQFGCDPLRLHPRPGASALSHKRIISWCAFFQTAATSVASQFAEKTCGKGLLPVPSQDGYLWYFCQRQGWPVVRTQMKSRGWKHCSRMSNIIPAVQESLGVKTSTP